MVVPPVFRTLAAVIGAGALVALLAVPALAQTIPLRVVQASDGTLYLVQGGNAWLLVPDQVGDDEFATLAIGGEVDGAIPDEFLTVSAPPPPAIPPALAAPEPAAPSAPAPPPPTAAPPAAPAPTTAAAGQPNVARRTLPPVTPAPVTPVPAAKAPSSGLAK